MDPSVFHPVARYLTDVASDLAVGAGSAAVTWGLKELKKNASHSKRDDHNDQDSELFQ